jgi:hypothetical protein
MQTLVAEVLAAWRRAERLAETLPEGPEQDVARAACERLRDLYRDLTTSGVAAPVNQADARTLLAGLTQD